MSKGFTLIEMLVVVLIIGILASVAYPQYRTAVAKSRLAQLIVVGKTIRDAEERFYMANGKYTTNFDELDVTMPEGGVREGTSKITYPNGDIFYLAFATQKKYENVRMFNTQRMSHGYQLHFAQSYFPGKQYCFAYGAEGAVEKWASQVCKSMGGQSMAGGACSSTDICPPGYGGFGSGSANFRYEMYEVGKK